MYFVEINSKKKMLYLANGKYRIYERHFILSYFLYITLTRHSVQNIALFK